MFYGLFRPSPWFKFEVKRINDRDLEVYVKTERVFIRNYKARTPKIGQHDDPETRKVWVVGRIPYERIQHIEWEPDQYYASPRFYVSYGWGGPFRETAVFEEGSWAGSVERRRDSHLRELHDVKYQGEAGNPWRWLRYTGGRLKFQLEDRRQRKKDRKEFPP